MGKNTPLSLEVLESSVPKPEPTRPPLCLRLFFQGKDGSHNLTKHSAPLLVFYYITQWYKIFMKELLVQSLEAFHLLACLHRLTPLKFSQGL